jgi:hypothetical protein
VKSFSNFIRSKFSNESVIDYLMLDIEGPEYRILPQFTNGGAMAQMTICQIYIELHGPLDRYKMTLAAFHTLYRKLWR